MALTERQEQKLEILPNGIIQVQDISIIERDGVEVSRSFHRKVIDVDDDVSQESDRIQAIAPVIRTPSVVEARTAERAAAAASGLN